MIWNLVISRRFIYKNIDKKLLPKITEYGVENKILSLSNVYHIVTTCSIPFLLIVPNFHVKVPYKRTF
ncbi:MAG TPA: hypothetical protein VF242_05560 [Nitrososphaeraceae archaeon]